VRRPNPARTTAAGLVAAALVLSSCAGGAGQKRESASRSTTTSSSPSATGDASAPALEVTEVATGLDTVWSLAFDRAGKLWFTQRDGRLQQLGGKGRDIPGVEATGEAGLMGLEFDNQGRFYLMYTGADDNRIVRLSALDATPEILVDGIRKGAIHDGGRLRFGPDGALYAGTGDAGDQSLPEDAKSRNGKILRVDPTTKAVTIYSKGHRNPQGLCFDAAGRFLSTEHGPDVGDEINAITKGSDGGWPASTGNGIKNYTPTIAPAGCVVYQGNLIPQWKGSMLFTTLKEADLRRLSFNADGSVSSEEVLYDGRFGRLRDVAVALDGSVYLATSNKDGRGSPRAGDDRILRIAPAAGATTTSIPTVTTTTAAAAATNPSTAGEPVAASDAPGLAAQIRKAQAAIDDPATPPAELARQAHTLQVAYRALVNNPSRQQATFALLDGDLRHSSEVNVTAGAKLRSMIKAPKTSLPPWHIVTPAPAEELLGYYREAESSVGVPWQYLAAIHLVETRMGRIRGNSDAGAQGPMQFLPATWKQYGNGGDINSNHDAILAAARYLKRNGAPGDMRNAIYNYNHDQRYVDAVLAYGDEMAARPRAFYGYHQWQVYYVMDTGDRWLPEGFVGPSA